MSGPQPWTIWTISEQETCLHAHYKYLVNHKLRAWGMGAAGCKSQQISQQISIKLCFDLKRIESTDLQFHVAKICKETPKYLCPIHFKVDFIAALNISDYQRETEHNID